MSSIILMKERKVRKDDKEVVQKKGEVISVPFNVGREMVDKGEANYLVPPKPPEKVAEEAEKTRDKNFEKIIAQMQDAADEGRKTIAELQKHNAELQKQIEQLTAPKK